MIWRNSASFFAPYGRENGSDGILWRAESQDFTTLGLSAKSRVWREVTDMEKRFQLEGALPKKAVIMGIALMAVIALTYFSSVNYLRQSTTDMLVAGATCNKSCGLYNCNQACGFCNDCTETGCDLTAGKPCEDAPRDCPCPLSRKDACSNYAIPNCISSCGQTR